LSLKVSQSSLASTTKVGNSVKGVRRYKSFSGDILVVFFIITITVCLKKFVNAFKIMKKFFCK